MPAEPEFPLNYHIAQFEEANGPLNYREFPLEYPKHGELLVKVLACGVCHTDVTVGKGVLNNDLWVDGKITILLFFFFFVNEFELTPWDSPIVPGHEIIGDVVSLGPGVKSHKIGERVGGLFHGGHCGMEAPLWYKVQTRYLRLETYLVTDSKLCVKNKN